MSAALGAYHSISPALAPSAGDSAADTSCCSPVPAPADRPQKQRKSRRSVRDEKRWLAWLSSDESQAGLVDDDDLLAMNRFTCPKALQHARAPSPKKRVSRAARRRQKGEELNGLLLSAQQGRPAPDTGGDSSQLTSTALIGAEGSESSPVSPSVPATVPHGTGAGEHAAAAAAALRDASGSPRPPAAARQCGRAGHGARFSPTPGTPAASPLFSPQDDDSSAGHPPRPTRKNRQSRAQRIGDASRAQTCLGDELLDIDASIQLFLLDKEMKAVRVMSADRHERKILQSLARAYKLTLRCLGNGEPRVVEFVKTRGSGANVDASGLRSFLDAENALLAPAELSRSPFGPSPADSPGYTSHESVRSPPCIYRTSSRMTRVQQLEAPPEQHVLELYYQRYKDGNKGNPLLRSLASRHEQMQALHGDMTQTATEAPTEAMYGRLLRAEAWLAQQRQNKHQIAARRRAAADAQLTPASSGHTPQFTPSSRSTASCGLTPSGSSSGASSGGTPVFAVDRSLPATPRGGGGAPRCSTPPPTPARCRPAMPAAVPPPLLLDPALSVTPATPAQRPAHPGLLTPPMGAPPPAGPPPLDIGLSLGMALTGTLDGLDQCSPRRVGAAVQLPQTPPARC